MRRRASPLSSSSDDPGRFARRYGPWALVTGAARGLGLEYARQIAERGLGVVMVDRLGEELAIAADEVAQAYGVETRAIACDLAHAECLPVIRAAIEGLELGLLVSNAAIGAVQPYFEQDLESKLAAIDVNVRAPMLLTHEFGRAMRARGRGGIILLSSASAIYGAPLVAHYAATKAYNRVLAESLWAECEGTGVDVLAVLPGTTDTPGLRSSRPDLKGTPVTTAAVVVATALAALGRRPSIITGSTDRVAMGIMGLLPRTWAQRAVAAAVRRMYPRA